jgi:hypothetical protein
MGRTVLVLGRGPRGLPALRHAGARQTGRIADNMDGNATMGSLSGSAFTIKLQKRRSPTLAEKSVWPAETVVRLGRAWREIHCQGVRREPQRLAQRGRQRHFALVPVLAGRMPPRRPAGPRRARLRISFASASGPRAASERMKLTFRGRLLRFALVLLPALAAGPARAQEIVEILLIQAATYRQTADAPPQPIPQTPDERPFLFVASALLDEAFLSDPDNLLFLQGMTLRTPPGDTRAMELLPDFGEFFFSEGFTSGSALHGRYPPGTYRFTLSSFITGNTTHDAVLPEADLPPAPRLLNFTAAQAVNPAAPFTLELEPFTGGGLFRAYEVAVTARDTGEVAFEDSGPADGATVVIPAGTLAAGTAYDVNLVYTRLVVADDASFPALYVGYGAENRVPLRAAGGAGPDPSSFTGFRRLPDGALELTLACTPGRALMLEQAAAPGGPWSPQQTVTPEATPFVLVVPAAELGDGPAFFRAAQ